MQLTPCQEVAMQALTGQENIFLTGVAGSGKSFLIQHFLKDKDPKSFPIVASTGAAAVLVRGVTFHSYFGLGIMEGGLAKTVERARLDRKLKKRLIQAKTVVIDEISMISGQALEAAETICRMHREEDFPWGGLRVIAVGDFGQLPPITIGSPEKDWAFRSETWTRSEFQVRYLKTVMRTQDEDFLQVLNSVRQGRVTEQVSSYLDSRIVSAETDFSGTRLFPHRASVEKFNLQRLQNLPGKLESFPTQYDGLSRFIEQLKKSAPIPEVLQLKEGAFVMLRKNDPQLRFVNGSLGHIRKISKNELVVELMSGRHMKLEKESFSLMDAEGREVAVATNFPLNLAWATTIHKSQGMTLDAALIDLSRVFEAGQAYVALSRLKSSKGLYLNAWTPSAIRMAEEVRHFDQQCFSTSP